MNLPRRCARGRNARARTSAGRPSTPTSPLPSPPFATTSPPTSSSPPRPQNSRSTLDHPRAGRERRHPAPLDVRRHLRRSVGFGWQLPLLRLHIRVGDFHRRRRRHCARVEGRRGRPRLHADDPHAGGDVAPRAAAARRAALRERRRRRHPPHPRAVESLAALTAEGVCRRRAGARRDGRPCTECRVWRRRRRRRRWRRRWRRRRRDGRW
mmetsp:Transcript_40962/g.119659  ORF Transcript_40962/g.119659 Transcript_40962/m.119659 type:complete len:210 (+) Transcript_40962:578-1207(+)